MSPTRACVIDTETTGLDPDAGHRVIEIAAVEIIDLRPTGRSIKRRINPEGVPVQWSSFLVHGIKDEDLATAPLFQDAWPAIADFIGDSRLIAHNAPFDMRFLSAECLRVGYQDITLAVPVEDSIAIAKRLWPGKPVSLDAVCRRLNISTDARSTYHEALVDCELLATAYCRMRAMLETPRTQGDFLDALLTEAEETDRTPIQIPRLAPREIAQ